MRAKLPAGLLRQQLDMAEASAGRSGSSGGGGASVHEKTIRPLTALLMENRPLTAFGVHFVPDALDDAGPRPNTAIRIALGARGLQRRREGHKLRLQVPTHPY